MKDGFYNEVIPDSLYHQEHDREFWLDALLENRLFSIIILKSIRDPDDRIIDFRIEFLNDTARKSLGHKGLKGHFFLEEFPEGPIYELFSHFVYVANSAISWEGEINFNDNYDKEEDITHCRWFLVTADKLEDGCLVLYSDITARKTVEERFEVLKKSTDRYLSLFNNMDHGFCIIKVLFNEKKDPVDYTFLEVNPAFEKITGLLDARGRSILEYLPSMDKSWFRRFGEVAVTRQSMRFEEKLVNPAHEMWYDVNAFPIDDPGENHVAVLFNNITNRKKRAENFRCMLEKMVRERTSELQESRDFIKHITDTSPDIMYIINLTERKISYISKGISSLGYKPEDIINMGQDVFQAMVHPDDYEERLNNILRMKTLRSDEVRGTEFRVKDASGKWHWLNNRTTLFKTGEDGRPIEILGIAVDITLRKETEAAYFKERDRSKELKRLNDVMDTFVYSAAHDLKAPISNLMLLTSTIDSTNDAVMKLELQKKYTPIIETLNKTISGMINVLSIEKNSDTGVRKIYFRDIVEHIKAELDQRIKEADATITSSFRYRRSIRYNESYLMSIFRNMITNSLKYRSDSRKPVIEIKSEEINGQVLLTFSDNGIGIDLERYSDDLFKPFKRFGSKSEGSGIGLHLVKSIVTKNGGSIEVKSVPREGTVFKIFLVEY